METPTLDVVICHNTGTLIDRCFDSLATVAGPPLQVILVTSEIDFEAHHAIPPRIDNDLVILYSTAGPAAKRNLGVSVGQAETIVFLDDDTEVTPFTFWHLHAALRTLPQAAMIYGKCLNMERRTEFDAVGSYLTPTTGFLYARAHGHQTDHGQYDTRVRILADKSACCAIRRDHFRVLGGFDPDYFILGEETDLSWRCWLRGWEVWYIPEAVAYHAFDTTLKPTSTHYSLQRVHEFGARNYVSMLTTNLGLLRLMRILPCHLGIWLLAALGFALKGEVWRARYILRGLWSVWKNRRAVWVKRQAVQATRVITDRVLMKTIAYTPPLSYYLERMTQYWKQGLHG